MKIEILCLAWRPNHSPAVAWVSDILRQETVTAELVAIRDAATAQQVEFLGSPSMQIDGRDIEPAARPSRAFEFGGRTYIDEGGRTGVQAKQ